MKSPTPEEVKKAREHTGLSMSACAAIIHVSSGIWPRWERGERNMMPGLWELFLIKTKQISLDGLKVDQDIKGDPVVSPIGAARMLKVPVNEMYNDTLQGNPAPPYIQFSDGERMYRKCDIINWVRKYRC